MDLSIIFVNWNSASYLKECLSSLYEHTTGLCFEVIVVDNASTLPGIDDLKRLFPNIILAKSERNLGFAGANNLGFGYSTGSYLLFLNPDTKLIDPAINLMLQRIKLLPNAGIVGCKLLNTDLTLQTSCIQRFPTIANQFMDIEYLRTKWPSCFLWKIDPLFSNSGEPVAVEMISGACMMVRRDIFERAGMFAEDYFMYAEDLDLCYQTSRLGFVNYYCGDISIIHHGGKSTGQETANQWATIMKLEAIRRFCTKTHGKIYAQTYRVSMACAATVRIAILKLTQLCSGRSTSKRLEGALAKWNAVLRWALGLDVGRLNVSKNR